MLLILNAAMNKNCKTIFFPKNYNLGLKQLNKDICDIASVDWQIPIETARTLLNSDIGIQGNMDPRLFFSDKKEIHSPNSSSSKICSNTLFTTYILWHG